MSTITDLSTIYSSTTDPASTLYARLQTISDTYLVNIAHIPGDTPNSFYVQLLPFNNYGEPIKSVILHYDGNEQTYCQMVEETVLELVVQLPIHNAFPWEVCGVGGCVEVSVGPCLNHRS